VIALFCFEEVAQPEDDEFSLDAMVEEDPHPELREWLVWEPARTAAGVLFLICQRTYLVGMVIDASPEEIAKALARPWAQWEELARVRIDKEKGAGV
jgi:hypothetical protein